MRLYDDIVIHKDLAIARAYAKVNLSLDVVSKREDNYHEVKMIMQTISLFDLIEVKKIKKGIVLICDSPKVPTDERNIAYKAAKLFFDECNISGGAFIRIKKNIPVAAGLAGGSADAAAVICCLDLLYQTQLGDERLCEIAVKIGADVPFCIMGGTCLAEGIGEKLTVLQALDPMHLLLVKPTKGVSTKKIYEAIDGRIIKHPNTQKLIESIENKDYETLMKELYNVMEPVTCEIEEEVLKIKEKMISSGALGCCMSGSGPTVYAIYDDIEKAIQASHFFDEYKEVYVARTYN